MEARTQTGGIVSVSVETPAIEGMLGMLFVGMVSGGEYDGHVSLEVQSEALCDSCNPATVFLPIDEARAIRDRLIAMNL